MSQTIEQRAWAIVHEHGPAWWNEYTRLYPNSKASEYRKRDAMAHYCVVQSLKQEINARLIAELCAALAELLDASLTETLLKESAGRRAFARDNARRTLAKAARGETP